MTTAERPLTVAGAYPERASPGRGLILMAIGIMIMPLTDGVAKFLSANLASAEIAWGRFLFQCLLAAPIVVATSGLRSLLPERPWLNALRGVFLASGTTFFFIGLKTLPLADSVAIFFIQPFLLTILAVIFEGERVGWRRWLAILIGFGGALMVIQPTFMEFGPEAFLPAASAACLASFMLLNRRLRATGTGMGLQTFAGLAGMLFMSALLVFGTAIGLDDFTIKAPTLTEWGWLAGMGAFAALGHYLMVIAFRYTTPAVLAPTQYLQIITSTAFGFLVFGDFPDAGKWAGIATIIACGIYVFWRETRVKTQA